MKSPWNPMFAGCLRDGTHVCWLFEGWNLQFCGQGSVALDLDKSQPRVVRCSAVQTESMAHRYGVSPCLTHLWLEKTHLWSETQHDPTKNTSHQKGQRSKQRGIAYCCKDDDHQLRSFWSRCRIWWWHQNNRCCARRRATVGMGVGYIPHGNSSILQLHSENFREGHFFAVEPVFLDLSLGHRDS